MAERKDDEKIRPGFTPGELDRTTEAPTEASIVGTTGYGGDLPPDLTADPTLDEEAHKVNRWEGGGRIPRPGPDTEAHPGERRPDERMPGNTTSTSGGPDR